MAACGDCATHRVFGISRPAQWPQTALVFRQPAKASFHASNGRINPYLKATTKGAPRGALCAGRRLRLEVDLQTVLDYAGCPLTEDTGAVAGTQSAAVEGIVVAVGGIRSVHRTGLLEVRKTASTGLVH